MRNVLAVFAIGVVVIAAGLTIESPQWACADQATTDSPETREPAVPCDDAVALAKEHLKDKGLGKNFFIRSVQYETWGEEPPRWTFILSPKEVRAPDAEPGLVVKMDRSVELIKGR
jgi:hypothetical protein